MNERVSRIKRKITSKGKRLNPALSDIEIRKFETLNHIELPMEYRTFISEIGNGGDGPPFYGLSPLGNLSPDIGIQQKKELGAYPGITKPFPFTRYWIWEDGDKTTEGTEEELYNGNLYIGNDGCGMHWFLIITGRDRGVPWQICGEGAQPVCPKRDFLQWYEDWLDDKDSFYGFTYG